MLLIWRNVTSFPPLSDESTNKASLSGRTSRSGLLTLLRRHVPPSGLALVCWNEWLASNRRALPANGSVRAVDAIRRAGSNPVKALHEIQAILDSKGIL